MPESERDAETGCEYTQSESLRKHALAVEACLRAYAKKSGADEELWGVAGLLHDFDYERWPNADHHPTREHPYHGCQILREQNAFAWTPCVPLRANWGWPAPPLSKRNGPGEIQKFRCENSSLCIMKSG